MAEKRFEKQEKLEKKEPMVSFLTWFVGALQEKAELKAPHMTAVKAYCLALGCQEEDTQENYYKALKQYGI